ncbi:hypothetical protein BASA81_002992 [Batrachochytrium salamandrivorans]|nr:hypothetical protein BASA81_002992 [Batrachochytrium salamandrivorans]
MDTTKTLSLVFASISVVCCCMLSAMLIRSHLRHFTRPQEQKKIIAIVWLAPIFAIDALLSLAVPEIAEPLEFFKEMYEAYTLYLFFALLVEFLGGEDQVVELLEGRAEAVHRFRPWRWCCSRPVLELGNKASAQGFFTSCKRGVMQLVVVRPLVGMVSALMTTQGLYTKGELAWDNWYVYDLVIVNQSMVYALVSLMYFFYALKKPLQPHSPLPKFMAIKIVIFLCFWQEILIAVLAHYHVVDAFASYTVEDIKAGLQNLLVCFEMGFISVYHHYAYPWQQYDKGSSYTLPNIGLPNSVGLEFALAESTADFSQSASATTPPPHRHRDAEQGLLQSQG